MQVQGCPLAGEEAELEESDQTDIVTSDADATQLGEVSKSQQPNVRDPVVS